MVEKELDKNPAPIEGNQENKLANETFDLLKSEQTSSSGWLEKTQSGWSKEPSDLPGLTIEDKSRTQESTDRESKSQDSLDHVLDATVEQALKTGEVEDLQKLVGNVESKEDLEKLRNSVAEYNKTAPDGLKLSIDLDKNQEPQLHIDYNGNNPNFGPGNRGNYNYEVIVGEDSSKAYLRTAYGIVPRNEIDPGLALERIQKQVTL